MLDETVINKLADQMAYVLERARQGYKRRILKDQIENWYLVKLPLIEKLRKHPNWDEDAFAIIFTVEEERELIWDEVKNSVNKLTNYLIAEGICIPDSLLGVLATLKTSGGQYINEEMQEYLMAVYDFKVNTGQKTSRVINKIFTDLGANNLPEYNRLYARVADALNPLTIKRKSILSLHPCDYLSMSYGTGWRSCHCIEDGCYMAGVLSYMEDEVTMVFYTIDNNYTGNDYHLQEKITRNLFYYQDTVLMQSRLYPDNGEDKKTQYREIVQRIISICDELPNLWIKKPHEYVADFCRNGIYSMQYPDYKYSSFRANVSLQKDKNYDGHPKMIIGAMAHCLSCGDEITNEGSLHCRDCGGNKCATCGRVLSHDDSYCEIGGYIYCDGCISYCEHCEEPTLNVTDVGNLDYYYVCDYCRDTYYTCCENCNEWILEEHGNIVCGINGYDIVVCEYCFEDYVCCDCCNEYHHNTQATYIESEDIFVCIQCFETNYFFCDYCYQNHPNSNYNAEYGICNDCADQKNEKSESEVTIV